MTTDFFDIKSVQEDYDLEVKEASGRDGKGQVPKSFWESYSAMANTEGGYTFYFLPGEHPMQDELFGGPVEQAPNSELLPVSSELLSDSSELLPEDSPAWQTLWELAESIRVTGKSPKISVESTILQLCQGQYLTLEQLAKLLNRKRDSLRTKYINPMVDRRLLEPLYPNIRNHPKQKYRAVKRGRES